MKIHIVGSSCCGKTTLCRRLSSKLNIPATDLDEVHWTPNWVKNPNFLEDVKAITSQSSWIINGHYTTKQYLMEEADYILWLDLPFWTAVLPRLLIRTFWNRILWGETCCNGNYETFHHTFFTKESMVYWIFSSYWRHQREFNDKMKDDSLKHKFVHMKSVQEIDHFVNSFTLQKKLK